MPDSLRRPSERYEVRERLGSGGMADVYRAHDHVLHRDVAIKVLRDVTEVDRTRFASEAQLLALLSHESIVTLYDADIADGRPRLVLELVEGRSMSELLRDGTMAPGPLAALAGQVAAGLAHAHARGVVHRDVKPSNILISPSGRVRLTDFGIARLLDSTSQVTLTGHVVGTAAYLAPEQVRGDTITGAADLYALGLLMLEALTGQRSFDGPPVEAALARLHRGPLIPTSLPPGWSGLLASMTAIDPDQRPTAVTVASRLRQLAGNGATGPTPPDSTALLPVTATASDPPTRSRRVLPVLLVVAAVLVLVLSSAVLVRVARQGSPASVSGTQSASDTAASERATLGVPVAPTSSPTTAVVEPVTKPSSSAGPSQKAAPGKKSKGKSKGKPKGTSKRG